MKNSYSLCQYKEHGNCVCVFNKFKDVCSMFSINFFVIIHETIVMVTVHTVNITIVSWIVTKKIFLNMELYNCSLQLNHMISWSEQLYSG